MNAEQLHFEVFYYSQWQQPLLLWGAIALSALLIATMPKLNSVTRRFCLALCLVSAFDVWLTANRVIGVGVLTGAAKDFVPLFFILAGDFRYFLFVEATRTRESIHFSGKSFLRALGWTVLVPLVTNLLIRVSGQEVLPARLVFVIYEGLFALLVIVLLQTYLRSDSHSRWTRKVSTFVLGYYLLWMVTDALLLATDTDFPYLIRIVPNILYYAGLPHFMAVTQPRREFSA